MSPASAAVAELRLLEYGQRLDQRGRNLLSDGAGRSTGANLFRGALAGGGQALGRPSCGIAVGEPADLVSLKGADPYFAGRSGVRHGRRTTGRVHKHPAR